jgi:AcrR family transcriptional regulator
LAAVESGTGQRTARRRRSDGARSHAAILEAAARLATVEGIEGVSISRLADAAGLSKSGLFAHFGSKEELQLATVEAASEVFAQRVTGPAADATNGLERLRILVEGFLRYVEDSTYPGGCFFASVATELAPRQGAVRDAAVAVVNDFSARLGEAVADAQREGLIDPAEDPGALVFDLNAYLLLANLQFVLTQDPAAVARARVAVDRRLAAAAPPPART